MAPIVTVIIGLVDKIVGLLDGKLPDHVERKKEDWVELKQKYLREINKPIERRDADKILNMRDEILLIGKEISK